MVYSSYENDILSLNNKIQEQKLHSKSYASDL